MVEILRSHTIWIEGLVENLQYIGIFGGPIGMLIGRMKIRNDWSTVEARVSDVRLTGTVMEWH